jgi:TRAP-type mannitol/chloroaromatic compound transport system substrate-binding protein
MDRRSIIKNAGIAGVLAAGVAPAVHAQAAIRWRLASSFPKALDTIFGAPDTFAKKVKAKCPVASSPSPPTLAAS